MHQAIEVGALGFLGSSIVKGAFFEDELPFHRELYAQTFHQLLMGFLDAEPGRSVWKRCPLLDLFIKCAQIPAAVSALLDSGSALSLVGPCGMYFSLC